MLIDSMQDNLSDMIIYKGDCVYLRKPGVISKEPRYLSATKNDLLKLQLADKGEGSHLFT